VVSRLTGTYSAGGPLIRFVVPAGTNGAVAVTGQAGLGRDAIRIAVHLIISSRLEVRLA
jgi:hypothetical protein